MIRDQGSWSIIKVKRKNMERVKKNVLNKVRQKYDLIWAIKMSDCGLLLIDDKLSYVIRIGKGWKDAWWKEKWKKKLNFLPSQ